MMAPPPSTPYQNDINRVIAAVEPQQKQNIVLPEQHIHLQTVLNELQNRCVNKTSNPVSEYFFKCFSTVSLKMKF